MSSGTGDRVEYVQDQGVGGHAATDMRSTLVRMSLALQTKLFGRYATVSAASLVTGHLLLYGLHSMLGLEPILANLLSTVGNTALVFVGNRRWVWSVDGQVSLRREVIPFAVLAGVGLALSTLLVWVTAQTIGEGLWINAANLTAFGIIWLVRFFVIDAWIFSKD
jgi:putative flippase GtrA